MTTKRLTTCHRLKPFLTRCIILNRNIPPWKNEHWNISYKFQFPYFISMFDRTMFLNETLPLVISRQNNEKLHNQLQW